MSTSTPAPDSLFTLQARKPRTRTVATRRVYGKRQADAPKAVLDDQEKYAARRQTRATRAKPSSEARTEHRQDEMQCLGKNLESLKIAGASDGAGQSEGGTDISRNAIQADSTTSSQTSQTCEIKEPIQSEKQDSQITKQELHENVPELSSQDTLVVTSEATTLVDPDTEQSSTVADENAVQPLPQPKEKPRRLSGLVQDSELTSYVSPILAQAASPLALAGIQSFDSWSERSSSRYFTVEKIAEGSYGEVYQLKLQKDALKAEASKLGKANIAKIKAYKNVILKIVPLRAKKGAGSKKFTSINDLTSELKLMKLLDSIPGFARFREVHVVQGRFPKTYQDAWNLFAELQPDECLNPDPSKKKNFPDTQLWAILEMDDAGAELEKKLFGGMIRGAFEIYDIFWGVSMGLARGEGIYKFEHRDLHLGNICIKSGKSMLLDLPRLNLDDPDSLPTGFGLSGVETSIIDFSLSRAELRYEEKDSKDDVEVAWCNLDERGIFDAEGEDEDDKLLRDTYRHMKYQVYLDDPTNSATGPMIPEKWSESNCGTNVVWLRFLIKMLLRKCGEIDFERLLGDTFKASTTTKDAPRKILAERNANIQLAGAESGKAGKKGDRLNLKKTANVTDNVTFETAKSR
ncbi:hypothetical protein KEM56_006097 [Ascosphaera pollenicola]|nr:hypothetical protein KEM56_006097 [Ascosphaera pollenicola]